MRGLFLFLLTCPSLLLAETNVGPEKTHSSITHLESGIICAPPATGESAAPNTIAGTTHIVEDAPPFISNSHRVPAVIGIGFGVKSMTSTSGGEDDVLMTIWHPEMGADRVTVQSFQTRISDLSPSITFYQFDFDYELLPGDWMMEASKGGHILFRRSFKVLEPEDVPELAAVCGYEELLS